MHGCRYGFRGSCIAVGMDVVVRAWLWVWISWFVHARHYPIDPNHSTIRSTLVEPNPATTTCTRIAPHPQQQLHLLEEPPTPKQTHLPTNLTQQQTQPNNSIHVGIHDYYISPHRSMSASNACVHSDFGSHQRVRAASNGSLWMRLLLCCTTKRRRPTSVTIVVPTLIV